MRRSSVFVCVATLAAFVSIAGAATLNVGPTQTYKRIQDAINVASNGDTILVDPGTYVGYASTMLFDGPSNITVKGNGGRPVLDMGPDHAVSVWGKGICTITRDSSNITLDNLEFKNAAARDVPPWNDNSHNGAAVRWDGAGLLRIANCVIYNCEDGILGTTQMGGDFLLENSVLYNCGSSLATNGTHNVYLGGGGEGGINSATIQYCWSYNAKIAYDLKVTARTIKVLYNRLGDEITNGTTTPPTTGGGEGVLDMPHGGQAYVIGNLFIKGYSAINGMTIRYGEEGIFPGYSTQMYVLYNTFLGQRYNGANTYIAIAAGSSPAYMANNAFINYNGSDVLYSGSVMANPTLLNSNFSVYEHQGAPAPDPLMVNYPGGSPPTSAGIDVHLKTGSPCINKATLPGGALPAAGADGFSLAPIKQYVHGGGTPMVPPTVLPSCVNRNSATDSGMYNFNNPAANQAPVVTLGSGAPPMNPPAGVTNQPIATVNGVLMAAASDDGPAGSMTYAWSKVSGPGTVTFGSVNALVTSASFSVAGVYVLQLAASDGTLTTTAQCTVQAEQAPVLTVPADMIVGVGVPAHLVGTATDGDGPTALAVPANTNWAETYRGNLDSPGYVATWNPTPASSLTEDVSFDKAGTYLVRLTAWDGLLYSYKTVKITVIAGPENNKPVVTGTQVPSFVYETWTVNLTSTASDPDAGQAIATVAWTQAGGKLVSITQPTSLGTTVPVTSSGSFVVPTLTLFADTPFGFQVVATDNAGSPLSSNPVIVSVPAFMMGDITHDGYVNVGDLQSLVAAWNQHASGVAADLNNDTYVNVGDLQALVANWGRSLH